MRIWAEYVARPNRPGQEMIMATMEKKSGSTKADEVSRKLEDPEVVNSLSQRGRMRVARATPGIDCRARQLGG